MAKKFNLIPTETSTNKQLEKVSKIFRRLSLAIFFIFILLCGIGLGLMFYLSRQLNSVSSEKDNLAKSIANMESTEQGLVLVKDRVEKLKLLASKRGGFNSFIKQKEITDNLPGDTYFKTSKIESDISRLELVSLRSKSLADLLSGLSKNDKFSKLDLEGIDLNPFIGYSIILQVF